MKPTRFKLAFLSYVLFDLLIGGHCGGLLPLSNMAAAQMSPVQGNITAASSSCLSTNCVTAQLDGQTGAASIQLTGTFALTAQFEVSNDNGSTFAAINCTPPNSTTAVSSATATGLWQCNVAGFTHIRVRGSAYTSGTAAVVINSARTSAKSGGGTSLPALSDNGTAVTSTEPILAPLGVVGTPSYSFTGNTNTGLWSGAGNGIFFSVGGVRQYFMSNGSGFSASASNQIGWTSSSDAGSGVDLGLARVAAASLRQGLVNSASPIAQTFTIGESSRGGTDSNVAGANGTIKPGIGTGNGAGTKLAIQRNLMGATGSTAQSTTDGLVVCESKTLSNTSATVQALANIALASNSGGGARGSITVVATDGTNFDSETQDFVVSYVNKATVGTVGTAAITASTAANNSGSATIGMTATFSGSTLSINATPVFTTIVPTTVTAYIELQNHGAGAVTCQ